MTFNHWALPVFLSVVVAGTGCRTGGSMKPVTSPAPIKYSLPRTTLVMELQVQRDGEAPGKYCDLLDLFFPELESATVCQETTKGVPDPLPGDRLLMAKSRTSVLGDGLSLKGTPDPSRAHELTFDASWNVERTDALTFTEGGTLTGAEMQRADRTTEIVLGIAANVAKIAGRFVFGGGGPAAFADKDEAPWDRIPPLKENFSLLSTARKQAYQAYWKRPEGQARLVLATRSYEILGNDLNVLNTVLSTASGPSAPTLLSELRKQISDRLSEDFVGAKKKETWTPVYELTPPAPGPTEISHTYALFTFGGCGVVEETTLPVRNSLGALRCTNLNGAKPAELSLVISTASGHQSSRVSIPDASDGDNVLYVIRPEPVVLNLTGHCRADVTLRSLTTPGQKVVEPQDPAPCKIVSQQALLAQWGVQVGIPKAGRDYAYTLALYEATGAVKSIKLSSKASLDQATIDKAFGIANTLLDARSAAEEEAKKEADAAKAAADELTVLARERQILEEKAKIKKLCEELGLPNCETEH